MSKFSGKCDFFDAIEIHGFEHILNSKVYVGNNTEPLNITCLADCVPYYPHIISIECYDKTAGSHIIRLSSQSWVDIEKARYGDLKMHQLFRTNLEQEIEKARKEGVHYDITGS